MTGSLRHTVNKAGQTMITDFFVVKKDTCSQIVKRKRGETGEFCGYNGYGSDTDAEPLDVIYYDPVEVLENFVFSRTVGWLFLIEAVILTACGMVTGWVSIRY